MQSKNKFMTLTALLALMVACGCANTATCDPDEMLVDDLCLPMPGPPAAAEAGTNDAATRPDAGAAAVQAGSVTPDSGKTSADAAAHIDDR